MKGAALWVNIGPQEVPNKLCKRSAPESYVEYWMGHDIDGDLRKTYTLMSNDQWRAEYAKCTPALAFKLPKE